jgi:hypothetical protein
MGAMPVRLRRGVAGTTEQAAVVLASVVYGAAMRDEKLPRPPLPTPSAAGALPAGGALVSP